MDVGIFLASRKRLMVWLIVPPLFIAGIGLSSYAWQQRAHWQLQETKALAEVLPPIITARKEVLELIKGFNSSAGGELGSENQVILFLQDMDQLNDFVVESVDVVELKGAKKKAVPVLNAVVNGSGDFRSIEQYINKVKTEQRLLSVNSIRVSQPKEPTAGAYEVAIIFELLLLDDMKAFNGGKP
jgi:hypothetical protein